LTEAESARRPRWLALLPGLLAASLGLWLIVRPFASLALFLSVIAAGLAITGVSKLTDDQPTVISRALGAVWIALGITVRAWPDLTVRWLTLIVAGYLIVDGMGDIWDGVRARTDQRLASIVMGVATVMFGVLALTWRDVTVLVVALVFAVRLVAFGIGRVVNTLLARPKSEGEAPPGPLRRWAKAIGSVGALVLAGVLALVSSALNDGRPVVDEFYAAPGSVPDEPGALLRQESFDRGIPDDAVAWRILYTTTRDEGRPALASAIVVAPHRDTDGPRPVIAWAHGTTGVAEPCAPSVLEGTFSTGAFFTVEEVVDEGWVLVATDYVGLGTEGPHPYLIGQGQGRSVLDAVRAARRMEGLDLDDRTVVWGHSQGGHAALWTGSLGPSYAPDVNLIGVAALAPAADVIGLMGNLPTVTGGNIFAAYAISAYSKAYEDVRIADYVVPGGQLTVEEIASRCLSEPAVFTSLLSSLAIRFAVFDEDLTDGPLAQRLVANTPPFTVEAPLLLAQGGADSLIEADVQDRYVESMCSAGRQVDYRTYEGMDHVPLVEPDSPLIPELFEWTHARLNGENPFSTC
jgi:uncharacterized membrane protein HdeD (DUF308 family)/acetyl esterase/lipase